MPKKETKPRKSALKDARKSVSRRQKSIEAVSPIRQSSGSGGSSVEDGVGFRNDEDEDSKRCSAEEGRRKPSGLEEPYLQLQTARRSKTWGAREEEAPPGEVSDVRRSASTVWAVELDPPVAAGDEVTLSIEDPVKAESLAAATSLGSGFCGAGILPISCPTKSAIPPLSLSFSEGKADLSMPCVAGESHPGVSREGSKEIESPVKAGGYSALRALSQVVGTNQQFDVFSTLVKTCRVSQLCEFNFMKLCQKAATLSPCVLQLGLTVLQLLLVSPRDGPSILKWISMHSNVVSTTPTRDRDLLPLPLPPVGAALKLIDQLQTNDVGLLMASRPKGVVGKKTKRQQCKKLVTEGTHQLWRVIHVIILNGMNSNWEYQGCPKLQLTELQKEAMTNINRWVVRFCMEPLKIYPLPDFSELVKSKSIDYSGEEVAHALPLRLEELMPGLPLDGVAGSLSAVQAAAGDIKQWVEDPTITLKLKGSWPSKTPRARINATREEWYRVCEELYKRGIIEPIPLEDVFCGPEGPVLNGAFAVEKKGIPGEGQVRVTRLIMNFAPTNSFQKLMVGDLNTLAGSTSWCQLILRPDQVLLWSGDDQKGAFYAWELPKTWRPFMAFVWPVPGHMVGSNAKMEYVASRVIPMGWIQAVSLFQHLHRQLGMEQPPKGAGHKEESEWRRDRAVPQTLDSKVNEFVQFYLDDFDCPEVIPSEGWEDLQGTMSSTHRLQRSAYERWGVGISTDKAHLRDPKVVRMGAEVDGILGTVSVPKAKQFEAIYFGLWCIGLRLRRPLSAKQVQELLRAMAVIPLAGADLRAPVSNLVTCSDASEAGGGLCCSGSLTEEGLAALAKCQSPEFQRTRMAMFEPQGAMLAGSRRGLKIVVVSLFDGIAALMCGAVSFRMSGGGLCGVGGWCGL